MHRPSPGLCRTTAARSGRAAAPPGVRFRQRPGAALAPGAVALGIGGKGDDVSPLQEAIERRGNQPRRPAQGGGPVVDAEIAGQNDRAVAVALVNDFVEDAGEVALGEDGIGGVVSDFVEDQKIGTAVILQQVVESLIGHRGQEILEHVVGADVADAIAGGASAHSEADREVAFADAGRAEEEDRFTPVEEAKLGQVENRPCGRGRVVL